MHVALILTLLVAYDPPVPGARMEVGVQAGRYFVHGPVSLDMPNYRNNGYAQRVVRKDGHAGIEVRVKNSQLASKLPRRRVAGMPAELADLTRQLNAAEGYLADQAALVVAWLRANIAQDPAPGGDQSLQRVLAARRGNCVGLANLAIFVFEKLGMEARYVTGVAFKRGDPPSLKLEGNVLHRWIEIRYDDVGWVFCDPAGKVNFVEATYLVLGVDGLHPLPDTLARAVGARVELREFRNGFRLVGAASEPESLRVRPNRLFAAPRQP